MGHQFKPGEQDQALANMRELLPRMWWNLYQGCLQQGFNQIQSFCLVQTFIIGQNPNGTRPESNGGPEEDSE